MDAQLHAKLDEVAEELRRELHQKSEGWSKIRTPSELFDFEQGLQATLNSLQAGIVGAVLEAIHRDDDFTTECRRQAQQQRGVQGYGREKTWVCTLGGKRVLLKTPYVALSQNVDPGGIKEKSRQKGIGTGSYPVLWRLGIVREVTPRLLAEVNRQIADGPSEGEVKERLVSREIMLNQQPMRFMVKNYTSIALWQRQVATTNLADIKVIKPAPLAGKRVVVGLDGGRLRLRIDKKLSDERRTRQYSTDQCEPKLFAIYTVDEKGNKERKSNVFYDGTLQSSTDLFTLLKLRLKQLGVRQARVLVITGDGASWIWNGVPELRRHLALTNLRVVEIVDWAHATGKLMPSAKLGLPKPEQQPWFKRMRALLKQGNVSAIIDALRELDQSHDPDEVIRTTINYFQTHETRMQYDKFRAENLPTGSGVIESGVRRIVNLRLKGVLDFIGLCGDMLHQSAPPVPHKQKNQ